MILISLLLGTWKGTLKINPSSQIVLIFNFIYVNTYLKGYLDVPVQSVSKLPFYDIFYVPNEYLSFKISSLNVGYNGNLSQNAQTIDGIFEQNGQKFELTLTKTSNISEYNIKRPQTPIGPFNYIEEEVKILNKKANVTLAGTLTYLSEKQKPVALVLLAHGSGGHDRDETIYDHKSFMVIADHLTKRNIAVLR